MVVSKSYKLRFYPNAVQRQQLAIDFGCARFVWNHALARRSHAYKEHDERLSGVDISREITQLKRTDYPWLADANSTVLTQTLRDQDRAFKNFFEGRAKYPRFKRKHGAQSIRYQLDQRQIERTFSASDGLLKLPKLGALNVRWSRTVEGVPKMVTVSRDACGRYFVAFGCEVEVKPLAPKTNLAGIDFGLKDTVVTSEGFKSGNPRHIRRIERRLRKAQRRLSRMQKGSNRYRRQRVRVARLHARVADARKDYLHKLSWKLVSENQALAIQSHNLGGWLANHHLARAASDASIGELTRQIRYKAQWYGRDLFEVDPWARTTGVCPDCGVIGPKLRLSARRFRCECGTEHDRDIASAQVIAFAGAGGPGVRVEADTIC